jgi:hypothetical protein
MRQDDYEFRTFHVEHVVARQHGGTDDGDNLCLACSECNWAKGPNLAGLLGGKLYPLFNPRTQNWHRHFRWERTILVGKTKTGIVTGPPPIDGQRAHTLPVECRQDVLPECF